MEIIIKCLFIGFLSSAPMGPVGMLCVQRTLNEDRRHGLFTGVGAALGDMLLAFIAIIAALGIGLTTEYIEAKQQPFQIIGSIILIAFGYIIFRRNPSKNLIKLNEARMSTWKVIVSSFLLTISNIGTLLLYMALFARFNIIDPSRVFFFQILAVCVIGIGAMIWWFIITYIVNKLRTHFNPRGLKLFNRIVGTILMTVGLVGIITAI